MSAENASLEDIFDGQADAAPATEATPPSEARASEPKGETTAAPPAADPKLSDDNAPTVPRRALEDERRKRQEYEQKIQELERYVAQQRAPQPQPQPQQQEPPAPDYYADPEGYLRHYNQQIQTHQQRMAEQFQAQLFQTRAEHAAEIMRMRHTDYDDVEKVFVAAAQHAPQLVEELRRAPNPAKYAYEVGRKLKLMSEIGDDPEAYVERRLAERQAAADNPASAQPARQAPPLLSKSLASTASATPRNGQGRFVERAPIEDLLG